MKQPLFSVLMTAFNRQQYIAEAIESVLAQGYTNFELIICDDCSTDHSLAIIKRYQDKDERVHVYQNPTNLGQFPNRNKAASFAKGTYLLYLDSDDTLKPNALSYLADVLQLYPETNYGTVIYEGTDVPLLLSAREAIYQHFFQKGYLHIGPGGTIIAKDHFDKIGGFPVVYGPPGDMYYNLKAASTGKVLLLPYEYFHYRRHEGQEINNRFSYLYGTYLYYKDFLALENIPLTAAEKNYLSLKSKRRFIVNIWKYFLQTNNLTEVLKAIRLAKFSFRDLVQGVFQS